MSLDKWFAQNEDWRPYADLVALPPLQEELMREYKDVSSEVLARCGEAVWENGGTVTRGALYVRIRREDRNCCDRWATMLCLQAPPGIQTSDTFWAGRKRWDEVFGEEYAATIKAKLARNGVNILPNQEYMPELARYQGDPEAVVPFNGARSYMKKLCEKRGWAAEGSISVDHRQPDADPYEQTPLAEDLIRRKGKDMVKKNPELKRLSRQDLRAVVLAKHGPSKTPSGKTLLD
jgi:hypothetical protein